MARLRIVDLSHRVGFSGVAGPRELGGCTLENPPRLHCEVQRPADGRFRRAIAALGQPELRAAYEVIPRLLPEPCEEAAGADEVATFRGEATTSDSRICFCEL